MAGSDVRRKWIRRDGPALAAAALAHVVLLGLMLGTMGGAAVSGGAPEGGFEGDAVVVSLAGSLGEAGGALSHDAEGMAAILARMNTRDSLTTIAAAEEVSTRPGDLASLLKELANSRGEGGGGRADRDLGGDGAGRTRGPERTSRERSKGGEAAAGDVGGVWGQIARCWRRQPGVSTSPVTLDVVLDAEGRIAAPPRIARPDGVAADAARLVSESRAIEAVAACAPLRRQFVPDRSRPLRIEFPKSK